jgi:UDP-2,4-diacetamido-2,4,6-trideoxy-beta-L-altropyranose hydrolase
MADRSSATLSKNHSRSHKEFIRMNNQCYPKLLIRADGDGEIGTGHIMRCLTLAQACVNSGGSVIFASTALPEHLLDRIEQWSDQIQRLDTESGSTTDAHRTIAYAEQYDADWIVVDGPHFDATYQQTLADTERQLLTIDDMGELKYYTADLVLNQNLHASKNMYSDRGSNTRLLLGPEYVLLRREFLEWREWSRDIPDTPNRVLITLGGSDPGNETQKIVRALDKIKNDVTARVIVGAENRHYEALTNSVESTDQQIELKCNVSNMAEQMVWADLAISSGGTTCWELAFMRLPTLVGTIAPIEEYLVEGLKDEGLFYHVGEFEETTDSQLAVRIEHSLDNPENLREMSNKAQRLVDGYGQDRVIESMKSYI